MTWLHLTVPFLAGMALYTAHRLGICFGCAATIIDKAGHGPLGRLRRRAAFRPLIEGYGYALLTISLAAAAGFIAGRIL